MELVTGRTLSLCLYYFKAEVIVLSISINRPEVAHSEHWKHS